MSRFIISGHVCSSHFYWHWLHLQYPLRRGFSSSLRCFLVIFQVFSSLTLFAQVKIGELYYNLDNAKKTAEVAYPPTNCYAFTEIDIPAEVNYDGCVYSVTAIEKCAFACSNYLMSVAIPGSVLTIGDRAFNQCSSLSSITIPNSVKTIGELAFRDCI